MTAEDFHGDNIKTAQIQARNIFNVDIIKYLGEIRRDNISTAKASLTLSSSAAYPHRYHIKR